MGGALNVSLPSLGKPKTWAMFRDKESLARRLRKVSRWITAAAIESYFGCGSFGSSRYGMSR